MRRGWGVGLLVFGLAGGCKGSIEEQGAPPLDAGVSADSGGTALDAAIETDAGMDNDAGLAAADATAEDARPADAGTSPSDASVFAENPVLTAIAPGDALDLGRFTCDGVPGEDVELCRRVTDYSGFVYDRRRHEMVMFGGGHSTTMTDVVYVLPLSNALSWAGLYLPTPCDEMNVANLDAKNGAWLSGPDGPFPRPVSTHTYDMLAVPPALDELIVISRNFSGGYCNPVGNDIGGRVAHFDRAAQTWSFSPTASGTDNGLSTSLPGSEPDPISGNIILLGGGGLLIYDPVKRSYLRVETLRNAEGDEVSLPGYANHLTYFPPDDRFYYFARGTPVEVYALSLNRTMPESSTIEEIVTLGPTSPHQEPGYDYDSAHGVIGGGVSDNAFYTFDPVTATWTMYPISGGEPGSQAFHALAFDPVNEVFVFLSEDFRTWAYRLP